MVNDLRDISLDEIYDFIENGIASEQNSEIMEYMLLMEKVRGMMLRIDKYPSKNAVINHLTKVNKYSPPFARKVYSQAVEYFYSDTIISKAAWRNVYAEQMEKVVSFAIGAMKDTSDASKVAKMIRGKHKPNYTPHVDCGDNVIVINAEKIILTGNKMQEKKYVSYSEYPGGQKFITAANLMAKKPTALVEKAVRGMLPKNRLGRALFNNLHAVEGTEHKFEAQKPTVIKLDSIK